MDGAGEFLSGGSSGFVAASVSVGAKFERISHDLSTQPAVTKDQLIILFLMKKCVHFDACGRNSLPELSRTVNHVSPSPVPETL